MELIGARHPDSEMNREAWAGNSIQDAAADCSNAIVGGPFGSDLVSADYAAAGVPVIRGQNMSGRHVSGEFVFVSPSKAKALAANLAYPGDLIFTQRGTLGQVALVPENGFARYVVSQSQMKVSLDRARYEPAFVYYYFASETGQKQITISAIQTGVPHTNLGILRAYKFPAPPLAEQQAIAAALSDADALLDGLTRLIAKKRDLKQAAMQQLLTGRTRLPGFNNPWKLRQLGEALTIRHGKSQRGVETEAGPYPILATGGQIGTASRWLYDKPSVLIGRKGTIDRPQFMDSPFWTVDTLFYSEIKGDHVAKFFYYLFTTIDWRRFNEASGVPSLNARTIENIEVAIPEHHEQAAIATVLSDMDAELAALETRRAKTQALKQAMMQSLLTGRIRLVSPEPGHA